MAQLHRDRTKFTLSECPVGLFMWKDYLCFKTEYVSNEGRIDAYIVSSGEFFWGDGPQTIPSQRWQVVTPIDLDIVYDAIGATRPVVTDKARMITEAVRIFNDDPGGVADGIVAVMDYADRTRPGVVEPPVKVARKVVQIATVQDDNCLHGGMYALYDDGSIEQFVALTGEWAPIPPAPAVVGKVEQCEVCGNEVRFADGTLNCECPATEAAP